YFLEGRAVRGTSEFEHSWQDAKWRFSSAANKDLFAANPERYAPQYGGYCAVCLALDGELTDANPKAWTIIGGKLYLNYSMHQRTQWRIRSSIYVKYGDEVWAELALRAEVRKGVMEKSIGSGFKIAFLPLALGNPGWTLAQDTESAVKIRIKSYVEANESLELAYFYEAAPSGGPVVPPEQLWEGGYGPQQLVLESVTKLAEQIGVQGVVTAYVRAGTQNLGVERASVALYVIDINQGSVYEERGVVSDINEMLQKAFSNLIAALKRESSSYSDASYRLAVIAPDKPGTDTRELLLGGDIYKAILRQPSFSITYADEPDDPSALSYLNRGGDWPYPSTNVEPSEAWQGPMRRRGHTPRFDRLYQAGRDLEVDAMLLWEFERGDKAWEFPAEIYVIDVNKQRIYKHKGTNSNIEILVRQAFDDFLAGRKQ
ncbi:MAG: YHS domain-containing protein, partial [Gammaproteobacteria bacterium]|nr:YHS domain-containing protein [Gammaproteobacteria bacterium]